MRRLSLQEKKVITMEYDTCIKCSKMAADVKEVQFTVFGKKKKYQRMLCPECQEAFGRAGVVFEVNGDGKV